MLELRRLEPLTFSLRRLGRPVQDRPHALNGVHLMHWTCCGQPAGARRGYAPTGHGCCVNTFRQKSPGAAYASHRSIRPKVIKLTSTRTLPDGGIRSGQ